MPAITDNGAAPQGSRRMRRATRWWLAGLLVGCLLPAGLAQLDSLRPVERAAQVSLLVPVLLRVRSRLQARRRALGRWVRRRLGWPPAARRRRWRPAPPSLPVAAHDVLSRRGPPTRC
ncbi:hypothetical protein [Halomonas denitrificans]|uniref:hypothetical protein n=1 Tax=Halomonas denitrificans TaxID=370769 RepID=UPI000D366548|nr:hypothetical protein [Halomonas denitrificans]